MASQLEKQLRVPEGKYSTSQLARLKFAKDEGSEAFRKAKKMIDSKMSSSEKPKAKAASKTASNTASKPKTSSSRPKTRGDAANRTTSPGGGPRRGINKPKAKAGSARGDGNTKSPKQPKQPTTGSKKSGVKGTDAKIDPYVTRKSPGKPGPGKETPTQRGRPAAIRQGKNYTLEQWKKMARQERKKAGLPLTLAAARVSKFISGGVDPKSK